MSAESKKTILNGLPPLGDRVCTSSSSAKSAKHSDAIVQLVSPVILKGISPNPRKARRLWRDYEEEGKNSMVWGSEKDIQRYVVSALKDVLSAAGLSTTVSVLEDLTLWSINSESQRSDCYLVTKEKYIPIGVVEVKKPGKAVFDDMGIYGQLFDYMMALRSFYGLQDVFGILSTYEKWRICWLSDVKDDPTVIPSKYERKFQLWPFLPTIPTWKSTSDLSAQNFLPTPASIDRTLNASEVYRFDDPKLPMVLISTVHKMANSPIIPRESLEECLKGTGLLVNAHEFKWQQKLLSNLNFGVELTGHDKEFWLLADLHGGADGNVWLASTTKGKGCIVKFSKHPHVEADNACKSEAEIWNKVWNRKAFFLTLGKLSAVAMPYVLPCAGSDEKPKLEDNMRNGVIAAIKKLASFGYCHNDLKWAHVGKYIDESSEKESFVLFDLAGVQKNVVPEEAVKNMKLQLSLD